MRSLHTEAVCWLRFGKRMPIVCTEVGNWHADVLGVSSTSVVEVEVKKSRSDLRADFTGKSAKHATYNRGFGPHLPNFFYFFVPEALGEYAVNYLAQHSPKAGVAVLADLGERDGKNTRVIKRAGKIHDQKPSNHFVEVAIQRMSSELCGRHVALDELRDRVGEMIHHANTAVVEQAVRAAGTLDFEDEAADLLVRATELAAAVEGLVFQTLPKDQQKKWLDAACRLLGVKYSTHQEGWINAALNQ